jgi:hypothetical protein
MNICFSLPASTFGFTAVAGDCGFLFPAGRLAGATSVATQAGTIRRITASCADAQALWLGVYDPTHLAEFTNGMRDQKLVVVTGIIGATQDGNLAGNSNQNSRRWGAHSTTRIQAASTPTDVTSGELLHQFNMSQATGIPTDQRDLKIECVAGMCIRLNQPGATAITGQIHVFIEFDPFIQGP